MSTILRHHAEHLYAQELEELSKQDILQWAAKEDIVLKK